MATGEHLRTGQRDGLFHVTLPGIKKDPLWVTYMESAAQKAVGVMKGTISNQVLMERDRSLDIFAQRIKEKHGKSGQNLHKIAERKLRELVYNPTLRDITDYIIAEAQYSYSLNDPRYQPKDRRAYQISNYGTPRELFPAFETVFSGHFEVNPYQPYIERARMCRDEYSDAKGFMSAPLAKLKPDRAKGYVFERTGLRMNEVPLTKTGASYWIHTDIKYFDAIWNHINDLYINLAKLAKSKQKSDMLDQKSLYISQIGWWYFQAMPYTRGSAAIGNGLLQSLFDFSSIENSPYKVGLAPDLEAFVTPLPQYAKNFSDFFTT